MLADEYLFSDGRGVKHYFEVAAGAPDVALTGGRLLGLQSLGGVMKRLLPLMLLIVLAVPVVAQLQAPGPDNSIKVGEMAPDFVIPAAQRGQPGTNLSDLVKTKNALIMFFPGAFTPGCTTEFTQAGIHYDKFRALNVEMIGISRDQPGALAAFKTSVKAQNTFVSDLEHTIATKYGAATPNRGTSRFYYLVDQSGKIVWKDTSNRVLDTERLATDIAAALKK
jgi:peroxiredoxin Q/BCP